MQDHLSPFREYAGLERKCTGSAGPEPELRLALDDLFALSGSPVRKA